MSDYVCVKVHEYLVSDDYDIERIKNDEDTISCQFRETIGDKDFYLVKTKGCKDDWFA